jgi:hypothetical protein
LLLIVAGCEGWVSGMTAPHGGGQATHSEMPTRQHLADLPEYRDCNGNAVDGRETDVKHDERHCGDCAIGCDGGRCSGGSCVATQRDE